MKFGSWWSALKISWKWYICLFTPINSSNCLHSPNLRIFSLWKHWNVRNVNPFMKMSFKTHSVEITLRFSLTHFWQKSRESNGFTKEITKELIWQNIFFMRLCKLSIFSHCETQCGKTRNLLSQKKYFVKSTL